MRCWICLNVKWLVYHIHNRPSKSFPFNHFDTTIEQLILTLTITDFLPSYKKVILPIYIQRILSSCDILYACSTILHTHIFVGTREYVTASLQHNLEKLDPAKPIKSWWWPNWRWPSGPHKWRKQQHLLIGLETREGGACVITSGRMFGLLCTLCCTHHCTLWLIKLAVQMASLHGKSVIDSPQLIKSQYCFDALTTDPIQFVWSWQPQLFQSLVPS